jgi:glycosyltransferase involved in cell wall biosynthesis
VRHRLSSLLFRKLWTIKPKALRLVVRKLLLIFRLWRLRHRRPEPGDTLVVGLFSSSRGVGAAARLLADGLKQSGYLVRCCDFGPYVKLFREVDYDGAVTEDAIVGDTPGVAIFVLQPPHFAMALAVLGRERLRHRYIIVHWAWETTRIPDSWRDSLRYVDEVWVPTSFVASAVAPFTTKPIRVVPYPISEPARIVPISRAELGLRADSVVSLFMYDPNSTVERKNPEGAISAFKQAANGVKPAELVIKANSSKANSLRKRNTDVDHRRELAGDDPRIHVISAVMDHAAVLGLIELADIVISLHRSEGFGLLMVEAMMLGKPVIATGWSGNMDFMNEDNSMLVDFELVPSRVVRGPYTVPGAEWAEPNIETAAARLRELIDSEALRRDLGERGRRSIRQWIQSTRRDEVWGATYRHLAARAEGESVRDIRKQQA